MSVDIGAVLSFTGIRTVYCEVVLLLQLKDLSKEKPDAIRDG